VFDLVLPSLPGYGLSAEPGEVGWDPGRIARAWVELMRGLGYTRYVVQGDDKAPPSPTRWAPRHPKACSAFT
jgi:pimeloyl-ACP methyl ester carboxylesterase